MIKDVFYVHYINFSEDGKEKKYDVIYNLPANETLYEILYEFLDFLEMAGFPSESLNLVSEAISEVQERKQEEFHEFLNRISDDYSSDEDDDGDNTNV